MTGSRELDVILYGATGFTGRLVAQHLARRTRGSARIGLGGRSLTRLEGVRAEAAQAVGLASEPGKSPLA